MTDIVERLLHRLGRKTVTVGPGLYEDIQEAATALEAKDKELAALRGRVIYLDDEIATRDAQIAKFSARAETAERENADLINIRNVLILCGELGGMQPGESAIGYLRRLVDGLMTAGRERDELYQRLDAAAQMDREKSVRIVAAERERDEARAALKPMVPLAEDTAKKLRQCGSPMADQIEKLARAARAITGGGDVG